MTERRPHTGPLTWVGPDDPLPEPRHAWPDPNGLLAAGTDLSPARLLEAYSRGIFPWYTEGQPVLWWSPDPRMVLRLDAFRLHRSLARTIRKHCAAGGWELSLDRDFAAVMRACAEPRGHEQGTWITPQILAAYQGLHRLGHAHSVEVRAQGRLIGGLYGVSIGRMFYGESMFARVSDASKVAIAALVGTLREQGFRVIDCQQNTRHLASLGAHEVRRAEFLDELSALIRQPGPDWQALSIEFPDA